MNLRPLRSLFSSTSSAQSPTRNTSSTTGTITLTTTHLPLTTLKPPPTSVTNLLAVNNHLLYASTGNIIRVINTKTSPFTLIDTLTVGGSSGSVKSIAFSNKHVYTSHQDNKIRIWKLTQNKHHKRIATLPTFEDRLVRSVLPKNYVNVRRHRKKLWIEHHDAVSGLAFISDQLMCSVSWDKYLKIWNTEDLRCVESIKAHDDAINAVVVAADGTVFTGGADRRIKVWGRIKLKYGLIATLEKHKSAVNALALNDDGSVLFSGGCDRVIIAWEKVHGSNRMVSTEVLRGHSKAILCLINVSDLLFSGSADRTVRVWTRGCEGKFCCLRAFDGYDRPVRSLVADPGEVRSEDDCRPEIRVFSEITNGVIRVIIVKGFNIFDSL